LALAKDKVTQYNSVGTGSAGHGWPG